MLAPTPGVRLWRRGRFPRRRRRRRQRRGRTRCAGEPGKNRNLPLDTIRVKCKPTGRALASAKKNEKGKKERIIIKEEGEKEEEQEKKELPKKNFVSTRFSMGRDSAPDSFLLLAVRAISQMVEFTL